MKRYPVIRSVPNAPFIADLLTAGLAIVGGFPLYLTGNANHYSDIDVYTFSWQQFYQWHRLFMDNARFLRSTTYTSMFLFLEQEWQLVIPHPAQPDSTAVIHSTDLSASACRLVWVDGNFYVDAVYPDDLENHTCRILVEHAWTPYRAKSYQSKGYQILTAQGLPYVFSEDWVAPAEIYKTV